MRNVVTSATLARKEMIDMATLIDETVLLPVREARLTERVDELLHAGDTPLEWGHPLLSTTPTSLATHELAVRTECLNNAVREIAFEVQKLSLALLELSTSD